MTEWLSQLDKNLFLCLNFDGGPFWDEFFWAVSGKLIWIPLYLFFLYMIYRRVGLRNMLIGAVCLGLAVVAVDQVCNLFKDYLPKLRPTHTPEFDGIISLVHNYRGHFSGTVSAHSAISFAIVTFSSIIVRRRWFTIGASLWGLLVAYSRIYIGAHFVSDVVFGILLGILFGWLAILLWRFAVRKLDERATRRKTAN